MDGILSTVNKSIALRLQIFLHRRGHIHHIMASLRSSIPLFRGFAPRLSREFFSCRHYSSKSFLNSVEVPPFRPNPITNSVYLNTRARLFFTPSWRRQASSTVANQSQNGSSVPKSSFPNVSSKSVAYWLLASAASVFGIVVFGGLTRLTESG